MTRATLLAVLLLLALTAPARAGTAYISVETGQHFTIDTATGQRGERFNGGGPIVFTPDGRKGYRTEMDGVRPFDTATNTSGPPVARANALAVTPDGETLLIESWNSDSVTQVATATDTASTPIAVSYPRDGAIAPDGRTAYVLSGAPGRTPTLTPIDLTTNTAKPAITLDHVGAAVAITPDGARAVVSEGLTSPARAGYIQVIDLASGIPEPPIKVADGSSPSDIVITPDGRTAYVVAVAVASEQLVPPYVSSSVFPFTMATRTVGAPLPGSFPWATFQIAINGDGSRLFGSVFCADHSCTQGFVFDRRLPANDSFSMLWNGSETVERPTGISLAPSPAASFTASPGWARGVTTFDATTSNNDGGSISSYAWDFGDGTTGTSNSASTSHVFADPGTYTVKLTTTNAGGCAAQFVYTGTGATCSGLRTATTSRAVTIIRPGASVATSQAGAIKQTEATLSGTVGYTTGAIDWHFEYGTTTGYGAATAAVRGTGPVQARVSGLKANTTYHYRLVATTEQGTPPVTYGEDRTFRTATTGTLSVLSKTLKLRGKSVKIALRCASNVACRGTLKLTSGKRTCATGTVRLKADQRGYKRLTVRSTCRKKTSAKLTSTVTTGQKDLAATVRIKR